MILLSNWGEALRTRRLGIQVRREILGTAQEQKHVIVDFAGVRMLSHSFADEAIGKLVQELGEEDLKRRVRLRNVPDDILPLLKYVLTNRASTGPSGAPKVAI